MARDDGPLYVYALAEAPVASRLRILGRPLRTLRAGGLAAIVDGRDWQPSGEVHALQEQHEILVRLARRVPALLPVRFGSRLEEARLRAVLSEHETVITAALDHVRDCCQMTLRLIGPPDVTTPSDVRTDGGAAYLRSRRARLVHRPAEVHAVGEALGTLVRDERVESGHAGIRATVFHLVPRERIETYRTRALVLQQALAPVRLTITGPWPPFAFAPQLL